MTPAEVFAALNTRDRPFRPFRLVLTDGHPVNITDQDSWCMGSGCAVHTACGRFVTARRIETIEFLEVEFVDVAADLAGLTFALGAD